MPSLAICCRYSGANVFVSEHVPRRVLDSKPEENQICPLDFPPGFLVVSELDRVLSSEVVKTGSKIFRAAILMLSDLSLVVASTSNEIKYQLWNGEVREYVMMFYMYVATSRGTGRLHLTNVSSK